MLNLCASAEVATVQATPLACVTGKMTVESSRLLHEQLRLMHPKDFLIRSSLPWRTWIRSPLPTVSPSKPTENKIYEGQ